MKRVFFRFALGVTLGAVLAGIGMKAVPALAYNLLGPKWPTTSKQYDHHTLASNWKSVVNFGADQWTNVTPSPFEWSPNSNSNNDITKGGIDGAGHTLAVTTVYYSGNDITRILIKFDSAENWYLGSGTPGSGQMDGRSVSAHEFGHAAGIGHTGSGNCSSCPNRATMCSSYPTASTCMRSLETDDRNALNALYP